MLKGFLSFFIGSKTPKSSLNNCNKRKSKTKKHGWAHFKCLACAGGFGRIRIAQNPYCWYRRRWRWRHRSRIATCLNGFQSYEVFRTKLVLELVEKGDFADQLSVAAEQGRDWMYDAEADLLVWGWNVEGRIELRFWLWPRYLMGSRVLSDYAKLWLCHSSFQGPWNPFFTGRC